MFAVKRKRWGVKLVDRNWAKTTETKDKKLRVSLPLSLLLGRGGADDAGGQAVLVQFLREESGGGE
jgi:hypothetical protein